MRVAASAAIGPQFEKVLAYGQNKYNMSRKTAIIASVIFFNFIVICSLMALGITLASFLAGIPVIPRK